MCFFAGNSTGKGFGAVAYCPALKSGIRLFAACAFSGAKNLRKLKYHFFSHKGACAEGCALSLKAQPKVKSSFLQEK
jgi:hypothetical protein